MNSVSMTEAELVLRTPFAPLVLRANHSLILSCEFRSRARITTGPIRGDILREAADQFRAYFAHRLRRFDVPLALEGTPFLVAVWTVVSQLETGELISYGDVARAAGYPGAHRGVAMAMRRAPYDLLIPAHRVIGSDGTIKGAGPRSLRRRLLTFEGVLL
jgi:methylated-DNA-[protein]-cysteine S-methyltransferase